MGQSLSKIALQLFDASLLALCCHGMNAEQLGKLLPFDLSVGIQKACACVSV